eukprot:12777899-Ditylum_brightwellii.AAC.1
MLGFKPKLYNKKVIYTLYTTLPSHAAVFLQARTLNNQPIPFDVTSVFSVIIDLPTGNIETKECITSHYQMVDNPSNQWYVILVGSICPDLTPVDLAPLYLHLKLPAGIYCWGMVQQEGYLSLLTNVPFIPPKKLPQLPSADLLKTGMSIKISFGGKASEKCTPRMQSSTCVNPAEIIQALTLPGFLLGMTPIQYLIHTTQVYISFQQHAKHPQQLIGAFQNIYLAFKHTPHLLAYFATKYAKAKQKATNASLPPSSTCSALSQKQKHNILQQPSMADNGFTSAVEDDFALDDDIDNISTEDVPHLEVNSTVTMEVAINQHKPDATESLSILQKLTSNMITLYGNIWLVNSPSPPSKCWW